MKTEALGVDCIEASAPGSGDGKQIAELRFNVSLNPVPIYLLAFAEAGNVWKDINTTELFDLKRSGRFWCTVADQPDRIARLRLWVWI